MSQQNGHPPVESANSSESNQLSAIRDILFGQNMTKYAEEFQHIRHVIAQNKQATDTSAQQHYDELLDEISQLEERLSAKINSNQQELLAAIQQLQDDKQDRKTLGALLIDMGKQIQQ